MHNTYTYKYTHSSLYPLYVHTHTHTNTHTLITLYTNKGYTQHSLQIHITHVTHIIHCSLEIKFTYTDALYWCMFFLMGFVNIYPVL